MNHEILDHDAWIEARKSLLQKEKEFTRMRDALSQARRDLPWERVDKSYVFDTRLGQRTLADLFDGRSQLIVYHFMFGAGWNVGCKSCSFLADHFSPSVVHLAHRDVTLVAASSAPLDEFEPFRQRMGWDFSWVSSANSDFSRDYKVSFSQDEIDGGEVFYNFRSQRIPLTELPGASVFFRDESGAIYHTYSSYSRGLDMFITAYHWLDIVPKGRDEAALQYPMEWVRHHDDYEAESK